MSEQTDFSAESEPTEAMVEQQQQAQERAEDDENLREAGHNGSVSTEDFSVSEALEQL